MLESLKPVIRTVKELVVTLEETADGIFQEGEDHEYLRRERRTGLPVNPDVAQKAFEFRPCRAALRKILCEQPERLAIGSQRMLYTE